MQSRPPVFLQNRAVQSVGTFGGPAVCAGQLCNQTLKNSILANAWPALEADWRKPVPVATYAIIINTKNYR